MNIYYFVEVNYWRTQSIARSLCNSRAACCCASCGRVRLSYRRRVRPPEKAHPWFNSTNYYKTVWMITDNFSIYFTSRCSEAETKSILLVAVKTTVQCGVCERRPIAPITFWQRVVGRHRRWRGTCWRHCCTVNNNTHKALFTVKKSVAT